jgi:hypothetical protein
MLDRFIIHLSGIYIVENDKITFNIRHVIDSYIDSIALGIFKILKKVLKLYDEQTNCRSMKLES